jgi:hypothetical protein
MAFSCGVLYVASNESRYIEEAFLSAESVKRIYPELAICLFTDEPTHDLCKLGVFDTVETVQKSIKFVSSWAGGQLCRIECLIRTPYLFTLHLDTDTRVMTPDLLSLFRKLQSTEVAMVEAMIEDSYSRRNYGARMFNAGMVLYKRTSKVLAWLEAWANISKAHFALAGLDPLPQLDCLKHVDQESTRRRLLNMDQVSLVQILSPDINKLCLTIETLDYSWNHRGSKSHSLNTCHVKISHSPALRSIIHTDLVSAALSWESANRPGAASLRRYIERIKT